MSATAGQSAKYAILQRLQGEGPTLLLAEQAVELADYACMLPIGRTVPQGKVADRTGDREVQRIYLGLEASE
jgi:ABC-type branched-subunit amino acid transport system ATPase component